MELLMLIVNSKDNRIMNDYETVSQVHSSNKNIQRLHTRHNMSTISHILFINCILLNEFITCCDAHIIIYQTMLNYL